MIDLMHPRDQRDDAAEPVDENPADDRAPVADDDVLGGARTEHIDDLSSRFDAARRHGRRRRVVTTVAIVVIVALAASTGVLAWQRHDTSASAAARAQATAAARADAAALATYSYTDLAGFLRHVKAISTPGFSASFAKGASSLTSILTQYKATSSAKVLTAGVVSSNANSASVLVVISQTVANSAASTPSAQTEAFTYGMVRRGGHWLLDTATAVGH